MLFLAMIIVYSIDSPDSCVRVCVRGKRDGQVHLATVAYQVC